MSENSRDDGIKSDSGSDGALALFYSYLPLSIPNRLVLCEQNYERGALVIGFMGS